MATRDDAPDFTLLSILFSTQPLTPSLSMCLYEAALELHASGEGGKQVLGDVIQGVVRNLHREVAVGAIAGPLFEADVETERGAGKVRFLLTQQALAAHGRAPEPRPRRREWLN